MIVKEDYSELGIAEINTKFVLACTNGHLNIGLCAI